MLTPRLSAPLAAATSETGWTLVELLLVAIVSIVIATALFTIIDVTTNQAGRTITKIDATQRARTALAGLDDELRSACLSNGFTPIQPVSTSSNLIFLSAYGNAAQPTPVEHQISLSSSSGTLTDSLYAVSGGSAPDWTFSSTPYQTNTLLTSVAQSGSTPVFQYFAYQEVPNGNGGYYTDGDGNPYMMLLDGTSSVPGTNPPVIPTPSPLSASPPSGLSNANAESAAEVLVTLRVSPYGGPMENTNLSDAALTVNDSIVLRLTPPPNSVQGGASFIPCQ